MKQTFLFIFIFLSLAAFGQIPPPTITGDPTASPTQPVCAGVFVTVTAHATGSSLTYRWFKVSTPRDLLINNSAIYSNAATSALTINTSGGLGAGDYYFVVQNSGGSRTSNQVSVSLLPTPGAPSANGGSGCSPSKVALSAFNASDGEYRWYNNQGVPFAGERNSNFITPELSVTTVFYVAINNGLCEGPWTQVTATIFTPPNAPPASADPICGSGKVTIYSGGDDDGQFRWYDSNQIIIPGERNAVYTTPSISITTRYYVAINNGQCESAKTPVDAVVNPLPTAPGTPGGFRCGPGVVTMTATGGTNGFYQWFLPDGTSLRGQNNSTYTTTSLSTSATYFVSIFDSNCESNRVPIVASINPIPGAPTVTHGSGCGPSKVSLKASGAVDGQYRWYTAAGVPISGETNGTYITPTITTTTSYIVAISIGGCQGPGWNVTASINTPPNPPAGFGNSACGTSAITLSASGGTNGQYRWYSAAGVLISGQTNSTYTTPSLSVTTGYLVSINNGTCESTKTSVTATINTPPTAPTTTGNSACGPGPVTLSASGGSNGQYRWYTQAGSPISGQTSSTYTTPTISVTTPYSVTINNGTCESGKSSVIAQVNAIPAAPLASAVSGCAGSAIAISGTGGSAGQYRWYTTSVGGTAVARQTNSTYSPTVAATTTFYVSINNGTCESARTSVVVTTNICNQAPEIEPEDTNVTPGGTVTIDLLSLVSDPDNNLDLSTLKVIIQPLSGARATIDGNSALTLDYKGITFRGTDRFTVQVCDLLRSCAQKEFAVEVQGDLIIYNGISPNGDGKNDLWIIQGIEVLEDTRANHVLIFNRWGDAIFEAVNYDNGARVFSGKNNSGQDVPAGTYFYKIEYTSGRKTDNGYFTLKR